jgi:hypothetical protein
MTLQRRTGERISKADLAAEFYRLMDELGRVPSSVDVRDHGRCSLSPFLREWWGWKEAVAELAPDGQPVPGLVEKLRAEELAGRGWDFEETGAEHRQRLGETHRRVKLLRQALLHRRRGEENLQAIMPDCPWWLARMPVEELEAALWVQPDEARKLYVPAEGEPPPTLDMYRAFVSPYVSPRDRARAIARRWAEEQAE